MKRISFYCSLFLFIFSFQSCENNKVSNLSLNKSFSNLTVGQTDSLYATVSTKGDLNKIPVTWSSSNPDVIKFKNGKLTALKLGTSIVTVEAGDKKSTCNVYVSDKIELNGNRALLFYLGDFYKKHISNTFVFGMADDDDTLYMEFNAPISQTKILKCQSYKFVDSDTALNAVRKAFVDDRGYMMGSFVVSKSQDKRRKVWLHPIVQGEISINDNRSIGNDFYNYWIEIKCLDYYENTLNISFKGEVMYKDLSVQFLVSQGQKVDAINQVRQYIKTQSPSKIFQNNN
jgi:hypothetical protein